MIKISISDILDDEPFRTNLLNSLNNMVIPNGFTIDSILIMLY